MRALLLAAALALSVWPGAASVGQVHGNHERAREALRAGEIRSLEEVIASVHRQFRGKVLDARLYQRGARRWIYEVKLMSPRGDVLVVTVDGRTARILSARGRGAGAARRP